MNIVKPFPPRMRDIKEPFDMGIPVIPRTIEKVKPKKQIDKQPFIKINKQRHNFPFSLRGNQNKCCYIIEDINAEFPASISTRGDSYYLRLDPRVVRFWKLKSGDFLDIRLIKVRRLKKEDK